MANWKQLRLTKIKDSNEPVRTWIKVVSVLMIAGSLSVIFAYFADRVYRDILISRSDTIALSIDHDEVSALRLPQGDKAADAPYADLRYKLANLREVNRDVRFVYLMSYDGKTVRFLADSEPTASSNYSPRGQVYDDASSRLIHLFSDKASFVEGPVKDDFGTWYSALSPVIDPATGNVIAVVGIDVPADTYDKIMAVAIAFPLTFGLAICIVFITGDVLRKRRLEQMRFRSELVSIASHELRTPLSGIKWGEESLLGEELSLAQKEMIMSMYDSTIRLQDSIEEILQMANIESRKTQSLNIIETDMTSMVKDIFATQDLPAKQRNVKLVIHHDWPETLKLKCDPNRMKRVLNNLVSNAIKYTKPKTEVVISYEYHDGGHLITIADKGMGIPEAEQAKVFQGFYRATNAVKSEAPGTGMGLYLSRAVIEEHGGKLWLSSVENKGTTVYIKLPGSR